MCACLCYALPHIVTGGCFPNCLTAEAEETPTVEYNKLGRDLAEPVFADLKARLEKQVADFDAKWTAEYVDESGNVLSQKRLTGIFADDIASWQTDDGKIAPIGDDGALTGEGTEQSPYIIKNMKGWVWFVYKTGLPTEDKTYTYAVLENDIDFNGFLYDLTFADDGNLVTDGFIGHLDGQGHKMFNYVMYGVGLFTSVGNITFSMAMSGSATPVLPFEDSVIENISFEADCANNGGLGGGLAIAAISSFTTFENMSYQFKQGAGGMLLYFMYIVDGSRFVGCDFYLGGLGTMSGLGMPALDGSSDGLGIVPIEVINCSSTCEVYGGNAVPFFMNGSGMKIRMSNSISKGMIYSTGSGEGSYVGGFLGWDMGGCDAEIVGCKNYATFATAAETGGIVGLVQRGETGRMEVRKCENFGDFYCIATSRANDGYGGIIGKAEDCNSVLVLGCKNYGNIYSGGYQSGIVGEVSNCASMSIIDCLNAGTLAYPVIISSTLGQSFSSGIAILTSGSITIKNCTNTGSLVRYSQEEEKRLGYKYADGSHSFMSTAAGILLAGGSLNASAVIGDISVEGCSAACLIDRHTSFAGLVNHIGSISLDENGEKKTTISIRDSKILLNCDYDQTDMLSYFLCIGTVVAVPDNQGAKLASLELSGIYGDIFTKSNFMNFGAFTCENTILENIELNTHADYSDADIKFTGADMNISDMLKMAYGNILANSDANLRVNNLSLNVQVTLSPKMELASFELDEGQLSNLRSFNTTNCAVQTKVIMDAAAPNDYADFKGLVHNSETPMFASSDWGWSEKLNDAHPVLKKFFWQEGVLSGEDVAAKFESLGFTKFDKIA